MARMAGPLRHSDSRGSAPALRGARTVVGTRTPANTSQATATRATATGTVAGRRAWVSIRPPTARPDDERRHLDGDQERGQPVRPGAGQAGHARGERRVRRRGHRDRQRGGDDGQEHLVEREGDARQRQQQDAPDQGEPHDAVPADPVADPARAPRHGHVREHPSGSGQPQHPPRRRALRDLDQEQRPRERHADRRQRVRQDHALRHACADGGVAVPWVPLPRDEPGHGHPTTCVGSGAKPLNPTVE